MNFDYADEEKALAEQARRVLADRSPPALVRELLEGRGQDKAAALWHEVAELGWPAIAIAEEYGGIGFGHVALCALAEEIGRGLAPLPMMGSIYLAADAIAVGGSAAQREAWLPRLASGEIIGTAAVEPGEPMLRLVDGRLEGRVAPLLWGSQAAVAVVNARDGNRNNLFLVDLAQDTVKRERLNTIDDSRPQAALSFAGAHAEPLGENGLDADRLLVRAAVPVAFEQLGGAEACFRAAINFVSERRTFGRLIGSYQAIKHRLADMYVNIELARSNAYYAAWALSANADELPVAAATARVSATEAYEFAAAEMIQLHGGIGFTWEADCHLHYRRSRVLAQAIGSLAWWQDRLVRALDRLEAA